MLMNVWSRQIHVTSLLAVRIQLDPSIALVTLDSLVMAVYAQVSQLVSIEQSQYYFYALYSDHMSHAHSSS